MTGPIQATFRDGVFIPTLPCAIPDNASVELFVETESTAAPVPMSVAERAQRLAALVARMKSRPFPTNAPRFTRDELHERR